MTYLQKLKARELAGEGMDERKDRPIHDQDQWSFRPVFNAPPAALHCSVSSSMIRVYRIHYLKKGKKERLADTCMYLKKATLSLSLYQNDCMSGNHCNFILLTSFGGVGWGC